MRATGHDSEALRMTISEPSQLSHQNPGWEGPGEPGWRQLGSQLRAVLGLLREGQYAASRHRTESALANAWNFHLRPTLGGEGVYCPCCGWTGPAFVATGNWRAFSPQSRCPQCDSRSRHRGLSRLLPALLPQVPEGPALIFAPERILMEQLPLLIDNPLVTTDYLSADVDYPGEDIQALSFSDDQFAFIMCNHVLEHVPDDQEALRECARVLKLGGLALFTMPGDFDKPATWQFEEPDSNGHLRHYGLDVVDQMARAFSQVETYDLGQDTDPRWHIKAGELAFVGRK